tara:strand:+ start:1552 stop:1806 length:255 start_codon:yes stop_codon:yes gene_type:complete
VNHVFPCVVPYKDLYPGEYVEFVVGYNLSVGLQCNNPIFAWDIRGIGGGWLMVDKVYAGGGLISAGWRESERGYSWFSILFGSC